MGRLCIRPLKPRFCPGRASDVWPYYDGMPRPRASADGSRAAFLTPLDSGQHGLAEPIVQPHQIGGAVGWDRIRRLGVGDMQATRPVRLRAHYELAKTDWVSHLRRSSHHPAPLLQPLTGFVDQAQVNVRGRIEGDREKSKLMQHGEILLEGWDVRAR